MDYKDYYKILGVERKADAKQIKRAYRKLALEYHPDKNPDDNQAEEKFKEINEAYEVLGNPTKRTRYDQLGKSYRDWERTGGRPGGFDWSQWSTGATGGAHVEFGDLGDLLGGNFSEFFNAVFGGAPAQAGRAGGRRSVRGRDLEHQVRISLSEAFNGSARMLQLNGRRLEVKIPAGAKTGTKVRISGQGQRGLGQAGDLYLVIEVEKDPRFERKGDDLHVAITADLYTAILGGEAEVATPGGQVVLAIPPFSQPGKTFRLKGRGMPQLRSPSNYGDLYARLKVKLPEQLTARERELFEQLAEIARPRKQD